VDKVWEFFSAFNIQTVVAVVAAMWYFTKDLKVEMREIKNEMMIWRKEHREDITIQKQEIAAQSARSDKLYTMFCDLLKEKK